MFSLVASAVLFTYVATQQSYRRRGCKLALFPNWLWGLFLQRFKSAIIDPDRCY